ncbi:MAG: hypothetical protein D6759_19165 [Chloroflexi bacterium]|nr:MAG: hypothetical protein D6759_19165 [Chloroflexota bacterium]
MHPYFYENPFRAEGATELEKNAHLALYLAIFLSTTRCAGTGAWGERVSVATIRYTCHAAEALHLIRLGTYSRDAVQAACSWLIRLPGIQDLPQVDEEAARLFPSRFKTLAWIGSFDAFPLRRDFQALHERLDEQGLIQRVLPNPLLATMIYADTLLHLEAKRASIRESWHTGYRRALAAIEEHLHRWRADPRSPSAYLGPGELSYAMAILRRAGRLDDPATLKALEAALVQAVASPPENLKLSDRLYCGIQLSTHMADSPQAIQAVESLIRECRARYERAAFRREANFFHALMLRLLVTRYGATLHEALVHLLFDRERENWTLRQQALEQEQRAVLASLIKERLQVQISDLEQLAGGRRGTQLYRVSFHLHFSPPGGPESQSFPFHPAPDSLVIKQADREGLRRAIQRYRDLPEAARPFFARHEESSFWPSAPGEERGYLLMEDLTRMRTLYSLLQELEYQGDPELQERHLRPICRQVCHALTTLHRHTRFQEFFGSQIARLYVAPIETALNRLVRRFPALKPWLRGFYLGARRYPAIGHYLNKLRAYQAGLEVQTLMMVHGDAHSRNIMLTPDGQQIRLIDLDSLESHGDYVQDFGLLLEDVCIYRFLREQEVSLQPLEAEDEALGRGFLYEPLGSELSLRFQRLTLEHLAAFAREMGDETWKARLWLASATALLKLAASQDPGAFPQVAVLYAEAMKLLDALIGHLEDRLPLDDLLFPGQHPPDVTPPRPPAGDQPHWPEERRYLYAIHEGILAMAPGINHHLDRSGQVVRYFRGNGAAPFAVLDGKSPRPVLLLACPPHRLDDPLNLSRSRRTQTRLQTAVPIRATTSLEAILHLIAQTLGCLNDRRPRTED